MGSKLMRMLPWLMYSALDCLWASHRQIKGEIGFSGRSEICDRDQESNKPKTLKVGEEKVG